MRVLGVTFVLVAALGLANGQQQFQQQHQQQHIGNQRSNQFIDPCNSRTRTAAHESQCDAYYECFDGQPVVQYCPNGLVYHGKSTQGLFGVCDYDFNVDCFGRSQRDPPIGTEHCEWLYGIFGHETSCTRYWTCWNGTSTEQFCIGGLLYNEETHACDWPQNVVGCQKHPLCKDDPNANVPLGKSCERYWACQGGYPRLQRCPATLVFDRASRRCISPPTPECDVPSTTPRPKQQTRQGGGQQFQGSNQLRPQQRRQQQQRRPQRQQIQQQEQEQLHQEQFVDELPLDQGNFQEPASQSVQPLQEPPRAPLRAQPLRPVRPQRPQFSSGPQLPFIPAGATPIQFNSAASPRLPPIPGAIPIRLN